MCVVGRLAIRRFVSVNESWLVVEQPGASYKNQPKHVLCVTKANAKKVCPDRWKHIEGFHVLKASSTPQAYGVRHLFTAHYQVSPTERDDWLKAVRSAERDLGVFVNIYDEGKNYENEFMCVQNEFVDEVVDVVSQVDFDALAAACKAENQLDVARNNYYVDKGFCSDMNTTRKNAKLGISKPNVRIGSKDPVYSKAFQLMSRLAPLVVPESLRADLYRDEHREKEFAGELCDDNTVEALRVALTTSSGSVLDVHEDNNNDKHNDNFSPVAAVSCPVFLDGEWHRVVVIAYSRNSIASCLQRRVEYGPCISDIVAFYDSLPRDRTEITPSLLQFDGGDMCKHPKPHLNKCVFLSSMVDQMRIMNEALGVTKDQMCGLLFNVIASEAPCVFHGVTEELMADADFRGRVPSLSAEALGTIVYGRIFDQKERIKESKAATPGQRHQPCNNRRASNEQVARSIQNLKKLSQACFALPEEEHEDLNTFSRAVGMLSEKVEQCGCYGSGPLTSQHLLIAGSMIEMFPAGFLSLAEISASTQTHDWLVEKYWEGKVIEDLAEWSRQILSAVSVLVDCTLFEAENLVCECGRHHRGVDKYKDTLFAEQRVHYWDRHSKQMASVCSSRLRAGPVIRWNRRTGFPGYILSDSEVQLFWSFVLDKKLPPKRKRRPNSEPRSLAAKRKNYSYPAWGAICISARRRPWEPTEWATRCLGLDRGDSVTNYVVFERLTARNAGKNAGRRHAAALRAGGPRSRLWHPPGDSMTVFSNDEGRLVGSRRYFRSKKDATRHLCISVLLRPESRAHMTGRFLPWAFGHARFEGKKRMRCSDDAEEGSFVVFYDGNGPRKEAKLPLAMIVIFQEEMVLCPLKEDGSWRNAKGAGFIRRDRPAGDDGANGKKQRCVKTGVID